VLGALFVAEVEDFVPFINLPNGSYLIAVGALTVLALIVGTPRLRITQRRELQTWQI
jgi:hypothetical protein